MGVGSLARRSQEKVSGARASSDPRAAQRLKGRAGCRGMVTCTERG